MEYISEVLSFIAVSGIGLIAWFLKRTVNRMERDIKDLSDKEKDAATYEYRLEQVEKKVNAHHKKLGAQDVQNTEFKVWLTKIDGKLDLLLSQKK